MASPLRAVILGQDYQTRTFWIEASRLFFSRRVVRRVSIERRTIRGFDDVVTAYEIPEIDAHDREITGDHYQNKFHVAYDRAIRGGDLADPGFINATRYSLLGLVGRASNGRGTPNRMTLVTPWRVDQSDPLAELLSGVDGELLVHRLFGSSPGGEMVALRDRWRKVLGGIGDEQMAEVLMHVRIKDGKSMADLDEKLDYHLHQAWLAPVDRTRAVDRYTALAKRFMAGGRHRVRDHEAGELEALLRRERLWVGPPTGAPVDPAIDLGIKSFAPFAYNLEDEARVLNLTPLFHGRETLESVGWNADLLPRLAEFLAANIASSGSYRLHFDTHLSIGFAAGYLLDMADATIVPVQRSPKGARQAWPESDGTATVPGWADIAWTEVRSGPEVALAIEVTHWTFDDAVDYVRRELPRVGRVGRLTVARGPSRTAVSGGADAHALAESAGVVVRDLRAGERAELLHIFAAAPSALMFLLGRQAAPWGRLRLYEFGGAAGPRGSYHPSFDLPAN